MKCPKCEFENLENATFCIKCGNRLDGKVVCPKCGEYIPGEAEYCPNCGKQIPHASKSHEAKQAEIDSKKSGIARIFNKISAFICLGFFGFALTLIFLSYFDKGTLIRPDFLTFFFDPFKAFNQSSDAGKAITIIRAAIFAINITVVIVFSTLGITKTVKFLKSREGISDVYKYVVIVLTAHVLTSALLLATCQFNGEVTKYSSYYQAFIINSFVHLAICLGFDCFLNFKKGQVSIFIARVLLSFAFLLILLSISVFGSLYMINKTDDGTITTGLIYHFVDVIKSFNSSDVSTSSITLLLLNITVTIVSFIFLMIAYSTITYLSSAFFKGMTRFRRFRLIYYMSSIALAICASALLIASIAEIIAYANFIKADPKALELTELPVTVFVSSAFVLGITIATSTIYSKYNRRELLKKKTTRVE